MSAIYFRDDYQWAKKTSSLKSHEISTSMPGNGGIRIASSAARSFLAPILLAEKAERWNYAGSFN
jgi:hypothetical protein